MMQTKHIQCSCATFFRKLLKDWRPNYVAIINWLIYRHLKFIKKLNLHSFLISNWMFIQSEYSENGEYEVSNNQCPINAWIY